MSHTPCPTCGGDGVLVSLAWAEWHWVWYDAYLKACHAGHASPTAAADEVAGEPPDGPEQYACPECGDPDAVPLDPPHAGRADPSGIIEQLIGGRLISSN